MPIRVYMDIIFDAPQSIKVDEGYVHFNAL